MALTLTHNQINFSIGDTIKVRQFIVEGGKKRSQTFEGLVMRIKGHQGEKTFTVRKISGGLGVERIWPIDCPSIEKITVVKKGVTHRAVLSYLRKRTGRLALKVNTDYGTNNTNGQKVTTSTKTAASKPAKETAGAEGGNDSPEVPAK